jgi:hypothetical protein
MGTLSVRKGSHPSSCQPWLSGASNYRYCGWPTPTGSPPPFPPAPLPFRPFRPLFPGAPHSGYNLFEVDSCETYCRWAWVASASPLAGFGFSSRSFSGPFIARLMNQKYDRDIGESKFFMESLFTNSKQRL